MTKGKEQARTSARAEAIPNKGSSDPPPEASDWLHAGRAAYALRAYADARMALQEAVALDPELGTAWGLLGQALVASGDFGEAIKASTRAIELNPAERHAYLQDRGLCHVVLGAYGPAIRDFGEAIEGREAASARCWRALAYLHLGRGDEALVDVERALALEPRSVCAHTTRAVVLHSLGRLDDAKEQVRACEVFPVREAEELFCLAELYAFLGRRDEASAHLSAALEREPGLLARVRNNPLFGLLYSPGTGEADLEELLG